MDALQALTTRVSPSQLAEPAPNDLAIEAMLRAGANAPDHARLRTSRFIVVSGEARSALGEVLATALRKRDPNAPEAMLDKERSKPLRAPLIIVVAAHLRDHRNVPAIEQIISAGAAAQNILLAAHALGFGGFWRTGAPAYDDQVKAALGLDPRDSIVAFLYLGTPALDAKSLQRPDPAGSVSIWSGPNAPPGPERR